MRLMNKRLRIAGALLISCLASSAFSQEKVVIANYGGMVADFYNRYCAPLLKERHNIALEQVAISDPLGQIKVQQATGNILWDMFPAEGEVLVTASNNGWLEPIDWSVVDPNNEMPANGRHKYGVAGRVYSMILAYRTDKVPAGKTVDGWKTFWDVKGFPGPRAMRDTPLENLEFALLADGVPLDQIYAVLDTPKGVDRAFAKLDEIKPNISVFWTSGQQPAQLLASGEVFYTNTWNGRVVQMKSEKVPVEISWSGGSLNVPFYSIPKGAKNVSNMMKFFNVCFMDLNIQKIGAEITGYPGLSPKLPALLSEQVRADLPTAEKNLKQQFTFDFEFWAKNRAKLQRRWDTWRLR
ncbi:ABC transporter substrate-binding protein [Bosea sp. BIWAKO-01]|uniref:ABC transporter substrate-binding protein n=1 Tax=Bosea sp. BIWAKO-01 TaxID=506668 RepID=UPI00086B8EFE|nr:ABC transporter substrate-binding protein [Bosea sp. BIWAKO-01]GAU86782.1 ABC transporter periplasmic spermidine putrescine-binding protein PotD [Bosea sp. BIWAKO-01]